MPGNTPGLLSDRPNRSVCGQQKTCVHVIVPGSEAERVFLSGNSDDNEQEAIESVSYKDGNVYFPVDGTQPTTPEAVEYSCANIDNMEDSHITDWYMHMFGVIPINLAAINAAVTGGTLVPEPIYVQAGWKADTTTAQRIISFNATVDDTLVDDPSIPGARIGRRALFEREFRKIASNPVGRVLLYRILIEIRRQNNIGEPALEDNSEIISLSQIMNDLNMPEISNCRNNGRSLLLIWNAYNFCFRKINLNHKHTNTLEYNSSNITEQVVMGKVNMGKNSGILIEQMSSNLSSDLFHELLHWFHNLRDPLRLFFEVKGMNSRGKSVKLNDIFSIGGYFYAQSSSTTEVQISALPWIQTDGNKLIINFEEMRTILGAPDKNVFHGTTDYYYLEGDDISENVFRLSKDFLMRLGHKESRYIASSSTFLAAINLATYTHNTIANLYKFFDIAQVPHIDLTPYHLRGIDNSFFTNMGNFVTIGRDVVELMYRFSF